MSDDDPIPDEMIPPGDPRYDGFRITQVFAWCIVDSDDQEGIPAFRGPQGPMPMVAADRQRMQSLRPIAEHIASTHGRRVVLKRFVLTEEVEVIDP